ncbi:uncharacterized protein [Palaemon carinicauda]|uniref:uncharacterized protein n=1 Tax=Palaemon carinicauda TaxID=392227 RepID=UPI0035B5B922
MRPWQITLESIVMLFLWTLNIFSDSFACLFLLIFHVHGGWIMLGVLGILHFLLNCWILRFQWKKMNKIAISALFLTQTAAFYMICRRTWRSLVPYCTKDDRTKKRKLLIAKYSLCIETWYSSKKFPTEGNTIEMRSCLPPEMIANPHHIPTVSDSCNDVENNDAMIDKFFTNEEESQQIIPMGTTKYAEGTYNVELNFSSPQELYVGEPSLIKFLLKTLQHLFVKENKLSYHIVTDPNNKILYITKSDRHIKELPPRTISGHSSALCNDIHYAVNLAKGLEYEIFAVTKRTFDENKFIVDADISKLLWSIVWPSAVIKLYLIMTIIVSQPGGYAFMLISPLISVVTWLFTQKGVSEPWKNVFLMIPLRLNLSVPRALLVTGIGASNLPLGAACYISVKVVSTIVLTAYIAYSKKFKNIELYRDEIDRYNYKPILDPVIQFSESFVYIAWAIWQYATDPRTPSPVWVTRYHLPLILFLSTLLGHVFGLTWLWFTRSMVKKPLKDPKSVLRLVQSLEYIRT